MRASHREASGVGGVPGRCDHGGPRPSRYADATAQWGAVDPLTGMRAHAIATADVNGDGWTDVFVGSFADRPVSDYQQRSTTEAVTRPSAPRRPRLRIGASFPVELAAPVARPSPDLDGDGDPTSSSRVGFGRPSVTCAYGVVLRANDGGRFTVAGTLPEPSGARSIGVLDYDGDGHPDLFIAEDRFAGGSSVLLRGRGDLTFDDVTVRSGISTGVIGMGVGTGDLNGDGRPDLFVGGSNRLFLNQGGGTFAESSAAPPAWPVYGDEDDPAGVAEGDLNGDGRPDLVIGSTRSSTIDKGRRVPIRLYLNEADGSGIRLRRDRGVRAGPPG